MKIKELKKILDKYKDEEDVLFYESSGFLEDEIYIEKKTLYQYIEDGKTYYCDFNPRYENIKNKIKKKYIVIG